MPLFSLDIEKSIPGEFWTNRYILNTPDLATAVTIGNQIVSIERAVHKPGVTFTRYRVSDVDPNTDLYSIVALALPGLAPANVSGGLPLFNVVRVDFNTGSGRPSRKYLRLPIAEDQQGDGILVPAFATFVQTNYSVPMLGVDQFVDVDGQPFISAATHQSVAMRQLRRGSRRRTQPILPSA